MPDTIIVLDFDSTIVAAEGLDEIAKLSLADDADRERKILAIEGITRDGMEGRIGIDESLSRRLDQLHITRAHVAAVVKLLKARLAPSFRRNKAAIKKNASRIYVVSSGFRDYVVPVCSELGIAPDHIVANDLVWNKDGVVINYDRKSPLAKPRGKADAVRALKLKGRIVAVGDGATDCEIRDHGAAHEFVAYCENIERENVVARADRVVRSVDCCGFTIFPARRVIPSRAWSRCCWKTFTPTQRNVCAKRATRWRRSPTRCRTKNSRERCAACRCWAFVPRRR